mgnify:CR=1 FL=1
MQSLIVEALIEFREDCELRKKKATKIKLMWIIDKFWRISEPWFDDDHKGQETFNAKYLQFQNYDLKCHIKVRFKSFLQNGICRV